MEQKPSYQVQFGHAGAQAKSANPEVMKCHEVLSRMLQLRCQGKPAMSVHALTGQGPDGNRDGQKRSDEGLGFSGACQTTCDREGMCVTGSRDYCARLLRQATRDDQQLAGCLATGRQPTAESGG